jgi:hypothetical protein
LCTLNHLAKYAASSYDADRENCSTGGMMLMGENCSTGGMMLMGKTVVLVE